MRIETLEEKYLLQISILHDKERELFKEARRLLRSDEKVLNNDLFNELYVSYKDLKLKEEFLGYCLMIGYSFEK